MNVTEEMVLAVVPLFQDTPTSINRSVPVPVVCEKLTLPTLTAVPVVEVVVPSRMTAAAAV